MRRASESRVQAVVMPEREAFSVRVAGMSHVPATINKP